MDDNGIATIRYIPTFFSFRFTSRDYLFFSRVTFRPVVATMNHCKPCQNTKRTFFGLVVGSVICLFGIVTLRFQGAWRHKDYRDPRQTNGARNHILNHARGPDAEGEKPILEHVTKSENPNVGSEPPWLKDSFQQVDPFQTNETHPFNIGYVIENPEACGNGSVDLLILIPSIASNFLRRRAVRETWAASNVIQGVSIRRAFLLGSTEKDEARQVRVNSEQAAYGDIVQGSFKDTFSELSRKAVMGLEWTNRHCLQAHFVLKADDEIFVNIFAVVEKVLAGFANSTHTFLCHVIAKGKSPIDRNAKSKWYVPPNLLQNLTHWPPYCQGHVVLMTSDVVPLLYETSFNASYIPVEDAFVYGILPELEGNDRFRFEDFSKNLTSNVQELLKQYSDLTKPLTFVGVVTRNENEVNTLWRATLSRLSPWAQRQATVARLRQKMALVTL